MIKKKMGVFIGRFQPLHNGHTKVIKQMTEECDEVLILVGSANSRRTIKNPFTFEERQDLIYSFSFDQNFAYKTSIDSLDDHLYNDTAWASQVQDVVQQYVHHFGIEEVVLYGHTKDDSSYYLKMFPQWKYIEVENTEELDATFIRKGWFELEQTVLQYLDEYVPLSTFKFLTEEWVFDADLQADWDYYQAEAEKFKDYPYPETLTFNCGDAVVECGGHILLIKRDRAPGRNAWALPGGFKNRDEKSIDTIFRELKEETNIRVPEKVLRGSLVKTHLFDDPRRSFGIPRSTLAGHIKIDPNPDGSFPRVSPADDAKDYDWIQINKIVNNEVVLFDDHSEIVKLMCSKI